MVCTFCDIYKERVEVVYENDFFFGRFDKFPVSPGHAEVIPRRHIASLLHLTQEEWMFLQPAVQGLVKVVEETDLVKLYQGLVDSPFNGRSAEYCRKMLTHVGIGRVPDAYNFGVNDGDAAGRTIPHLHIHVIPRFYGDVDSPVGGVRNIIPGMGDYKK